MGADHEIFIYFICSDIFRVYTVSMPLMCICVHLLVYVCVCVEPVHFRPYISCTMLLHTRNALLPLSLSSFPPNSFKCSNIWLDFKHCMFFASYNSTNNISFHLENVVQFRGIWVYTWDYVFMCLWFFDRNSKLQICKAKLNEVREKAQKKGEPELTSNAKYTTLNVTE